MSTRDALMLTEQFPLGACPECHSDGEMLTVGEENWMVCHEHRVRWTLGNMFDDWQDEAASRANWDRISEYRRIDPYIGRMVPIDFVGGQRDKVLAGALALLYADPLSGPDCCAAIGVAHELGLLDEFEKAITDLRRRRDEKAEQERRDREGFDRRLAELLAHHRALAEAGAQ